MQKTHSALTRKKALSIVLIIGILLLVAIITRLFIPAEKAGYDVSTLEGREAFFKSLGWEIDRDSEEFRTVIVPEKLEGIMLQYNKMQLAQGYDLNGHLGERCSQYSYELTNYPNCDSKVIISIYLQDKEVIAGDIHTSSANGFMHGLKKEAQ